MTYRSLAARLGSLLQSADRGTVRQGGRHGSGGAVHGDVEIRRAVDVHERQEIPERNGVGGGDGHGRSGVYVVEVHCDHFEAPFVGFALVGFDGLRG